LRLGYQEVVNRQAEILADMAGISAEAARERFNVRAVGGGMLDYNYEHWRVIKALRQQAEWELRGNAYHRNPLRIRGIWFRDIEVKARVKEIVRCVTGHQYPGHMDYYDGYDPAVLAETGRHGLYACHMDSCSGLFMRPVLIHPLDVGGKSDD
jgi:hypothetical protein